MELFEEQGFENTSTIEVAERARVTTRTFFRYFSDKREVLFAESEHLRTVLIERIVTAPGDMAPLELVTWALAEFDWESIASRESQRRRQAVIAANPELLERDLIKQQQMEVGLIAALCERGVAKEIAQLAACVGIHVFRTAYERWLNGGGDTTTVATISANVLADLATIVPTGAPTRSAPSRITRTPARAGNSSAGGRRAAAPTSKVNTGATHRQEPAARSRKRSG
jgi:AcrR family transcriptional regulator